MKKVSIGLIKEGKFPYDARVAFSPLQCRQLLDTYPNIDIKVQSSDIRTFDDKEYSDLGINVSADVSGCDVLFGIKEIPVDMLIEEKTYLFFSHTIKKQPHNKKLLQAILTKKIRLIDYERITDTNGQRILGFGRYAGITGVYNGIRGYGLRHGLFDIKPAYCCHDREEAEQELLKIQLPNIKIALTGTGRVANGAGEILNFLNVKKILPEEFLKYDYDYPVFCQLDVLQYNQRKDGKVLDMQDFFQHPEEYQSAFIPFTKKSDLFLSCHYWDTKAPKLFTKEDMRQSEFSISVIADITCDIDGSVPSTLRSSTIQEPFYGYNPATEKEALPFDNGCITVMAVDNLPNELPRDSTEDFGYGLMKKVIPSLIEGDTEGMLERATIAANGGLTNKYSYLSDFIA